MQMYISYTGWHITHNYFLQNVTHVGITYFNLFVDL